MATAQMPPVQSIAGGEALPVRGDRLWTNSPTSSIDSASSDDLLEESDSSLDSSDAASSSASDEETDVFHVSPTDAALAYVYPPSPPVATAKLALKPASPADSLASSNDYFAATKHGSTFLTKVFPRSKVVGRATPVAAKLADWHLAVFDAGADGERTLYARGAAGFDDMNLRENLVGLLDCADEELDCDSVVVVLDKKDPNLASILHSLMYVGGVVIPASSASIHKKHSSKCVLVGIEL